MADPQPLNLTDLTAEQAVKALVSGATLRLADGNDLSLTDEDARKALRFFLKDAAGKRLWISPPRAGSTEIATALFKWLDAPHQNEVVSAKGDDGVGPLWRVTRLSISNFGGLHPFWSGDGAAPPVLDIDFERDVTLIEGGNGSGKTSLAKAMTFCLTGQVCRSSGPPVSWDLLRNDYLLPMEDIVAVEGDEEAEAPEAPERPGVSLPSIVPMPTAEQWKRATEKGITVKVAVAVTLSDGTRTTTIQRSLSNPKGKFSATLLADGGPIPSGSPALHLGISELALELATVHLARLPFIRIGEADDLGKALAELTGLTPLGTVATQTAPLLARYLRGSFLTGAKSVFHFDVTGQVAKSTHAWLPWLLFLRRRLGAKVRFWPFDGWEAFPGRSVIAEIYPALWKHGFPQGNRDVHQHDAYCAAAWMSRADREGHLAAAFTPSLTPPQKTVAAVEGWILGVT